MGSPEIDLTEAEQAVLSAIEADFPVSWAPYCDVGDVIGQDEVDVLNVVLKLRMMGVTPRIGATFAEGFAPSDESDSALAELIADVPSSEHPFEEIAGMLELRGVDVSDEWVMARIKEWIADGSIAEWGVERG